MTTLPTSTAIVRTILASPDAVTTTIGAVEAWMVDHAAEVAGHEVAWAASRAVSDCLAAIDAGASSRLPAEQLRVLRGLPVAAQVAVALHHFAGLDVDTTAAVTARTPEEVRSLIGRERPSTPPVAVEPVQTPPVETPPVETPRVETPRAVTPPPVPPGSGPPAPPIFPGPSTDRAEEPERVRRRRSSSPNRPWSTSRSSTSRSSDTRSSDTPSAPRPNRPRWWFIVIAVVLALIAGGIALSNRRDRPAARPTPVPGGLGDASTVSRDQLSPGCSSPEGDQALAPTNVDLTLDGQARSYRIVAPAAVTPGAPRPLVIDFTDLAQSVDAHVAESRLDQLANALKLIVVTPTALGTPSRWNVADDSGSPDDVALIDEIIQRQSEQLCVDRTRILVMGRGMGAHFAAAYACERPGVVAGAIFVAGVYRPSTCASDLQLSVLSIAGSADQTYPTRGGTGPEFSAIAGANDLGDGANYRLASIDQALDRYAKAMECAGEASMPLGLATIHIATSCTDNAEVWRLAVDSGHGWFDVTYDVVIRFLTEGPIAVQ